ncbi:TPA: hypothetical protein L4E95_001360 [Pseudomonas aeruginosa]|nr:hypothetical protein [Pseudomonas aeruginosa]
MNERIIYQQPGQLLSILIPCACGLSIVQIGQKDVPDGVPFWIVEATDIPSDRTFREAWEIDMEQLGEPDGHGGTFVDPEGELA